MARKKTIRRSIYDPLFKSPPKKQKKILFFKGEALIAIKEPKKKTYIGIANPFKLSPLEALGVRRPKRSKARNIFTGR